MKIVATVGDVVVAKEFAYRGLNRGTVLVGNSSLTQKDDGVRIKAKVTKAWYDDECGWRYHAMPLDRDLVKQGKSAENVVFISEFDMLEINELKVREPSGSVGGGIKQLRE